ncbi:MAG: transcriptional regulator [Cyanobacteria bacterium]|jgi:HTH-type transcriptional regulator/antitoxin HigA|nr:transcriptional regulator [Cyanobacteria bacterium GSL.Bin1]
MTISVPNEKYGFLLSQYQPRPIQSESDYENAVAVIEELMEKGLDPEETTLLNLLCALVEDYEETQLAGEDLTSPLEVLQHLMESNRLKQADLVGIIGSKGVVSEILNGKRSISKAQAKALGELFHVSPALFI